MAQPQTTHEERSRRDIRWSPRQKEVLDLLAKGRTNREIAEELGVSLDGAKWHVSEVITKLDVDTREEAAEWWRQQKGLRARMRVLTRTGLRPALTPVALRWAGGVAGAVLLAGIVAAVAVVLVRSGDSDDAAAPDVTPQPGPTEPANDSGNAAGAPAPTGTPALAIPDEVMGREVRQFSVAEPEGIPGEGMLILSEMPDLDGGVLVLKRAYVDPSSGDPVVENIGPLTDGLILQITASGETDGGLYAAGLSQLPPEGESTIWHSVDGGVTWSEVATFPSFARILQVRDGELLVQQSWGGSLFGTIGDGERPPEVVRIVEGEVRETGLSPLDAPDGSTRAFIDGQAFEVDRERGAIVGDAGDILWRPQLEPPPCARCPVTFATWPDTDLRVVHWQPSGLEPLLALYEGEDLLQVYVAGPVDHEFQPGPTGGQGFRWLDEQERTALGTAACEEAFEPAISPVCELPAVLDFDAGTLTPIEPAAILEAAAGAGAHAIEAYIPGPLAKVTGAGTCLNVREQPTTAASIVDCFVDGVILRVLPSTASADGYEWVQVEAPDGRSGWAAAEFLAR